MSAPGLTRAWTRLATLDPARLQRLSREGGWIVAGQVATVLGAVALVRVLTEYLQPAQYGELALGLTLAGLVSQAVVGGITSSTGRFYAIAVEQNDVNGYVRAAARLMSYATLAIAAIAIVVVAGLWSTGRTQWITLAVAVLTFAVFAAYNGALSAAQNAARQRAVVALHSAMDAWLKIALAVVALRWFGVSATAVVIGYALSALVVTLSQMLFLRRLVQGRRAAPVAARSHGWTGEMWAYAAPFSVFGVFTWMQQVTDRWSLERFATRHDVGQYGVVFQLGYMPMSVLTGLAMSFIGPILYQRAGSATDPARNAHVHSMAWRITTVSLTLTGVAFVLTLFLHEWLFSLLVAAPFRSASHLFPWVILAGGLFAAGQMLALKLMSEMKVSTMSLAKSVTALTGAVLNVIGAWLYGVAGVVAAVVAFSVLFFIWMASLATRPQPASPG